jgi:hypothetical protein
MTGRGWWLFLACAGVIGVVALTPAIAAANIGLPMVAVFLPPAWLALIPIIVMESAYGIYRFRTSAERTWAGVTTANCISTLVGLSVTWALLALGQALLFARFPEFAMAMPLSLLTIVGAPWLGPGAEQSPWMVPLATIVLLIPFYTMSVACEYVVVRRFLPDLSSRTVRSWMLQANVVSYAFLLLVMLVGWMWPKSFERMSALVFPVTRWLVESVMRLMQLLLGA